MNGKLGWLGAYNRPKALGPISTSNHHDEETVSAGHACKERELKVLKAENMKLKRDFKELSGALKQLTGESSHEKFDERRINLLKLQIIQLERQVAVLNEALGCRHEAMLEVENTMAAVADKLRSFISAEVKGPLVPIARSDLMSLVECSESTRIKLFKTIEASGKDSVGKDLLLLNPFLEGKYKQIDQVSLLDISLNRFNFMNLGHVAQLESKLCTLYKDLIRVFEQLETVARSPVHVGQTDSASWNRMKTTVLKTCVIGKDVSDDLMALSLLCPSSPWPVLKRPICKEVPVERVISSLPAIASRQKQEEIVHTFETSIGVCNHRQLMLEKEKAVLKEELAFYRATHDLQVQYTKSLFEAVRKGYGEFEASAKATIIKPIKNMLEAYSELKGSASEQALRDFLLIIKDNEQQLDDVVQMFERHDFETDETGGAAFSKFSSEFFSKLDDLVGDCQRQRDNAITTRKGITEQQHRKDQELQQLIENLEAKYEKQWNPLNTHFSKEEESLKVNRRAKNEKQLPQADVKDESINCKGIGSEVQPCTKDDPTILRSYLYSENTDSLDSAFKDHTDPSCPESSTSGDKKSLKKKTRWKPKQDWVSDLSTPICKSEERHSGERNWSSEMKSEVKKEWDNNFSEPSSLGKKSEISLESELTAVSPHGDNVNSIQQSSNSLPCDKSTKKPPLSYEPCLYVANRTLKLRSAGSLRNLSSSKNEDGANDVTKRKQSGSGSESLGSCSSASTEPVKSRIIPQKPKVPPKRSSWR